MPLLYDGIRGGCKSGTEGGRARPGSLVLGGVEALAGRRRPLVKLCLFKPRVRGRACGGTALRPRCGT
nr:MAG TPA: hypothetical protein [Caudoviricetes sp.]